MTVERDVDALPDDFVTRCATDLDLYLHPLLEEPPTKSSASADQWREYEGLVARARQSCAACPILEDCLYKAIVQVDVAGYVGCTTPRERQAIRAQLGVSISADDLDTFAGTRAERQPVNHDDVLRMRAAYPDDSLETLALRLDCSLSTVKRHLRRARRAADDAANDAASGRRSAGRRTSRLPSVDDVFDAFERVVEHR